METNASLFDYGIFNEDSDVRAHVGVLAKRVYVFKTQYGIDAIREYRPRIASAFQDGVDGETARGYLVKPEWICDIRIIRLTSWRFWENWNHGMSLKKKGMMAVDLVCRLLRRGHFPMWIYASEDDRRSVQVSGTDIIVFAKQRIQVKCDYSAGPKEIPGCTGNLYLQFAERNPLGIH